MKSSISKKISSSENNESVFDVYEIQYDVQLAANIINARLKLGMTQERLAKKMGMLQPAIARLENNDTPPSHKMLKKLARAFSARLLPPKFVLQEAIVNHGSNYILSGSAILISGTTSGYAETNKSNPFFQPIVKATQRVIA